MATFRRAILGLVPAALAIAVLTPACDAGHSQPVTPPSEGGRMSFSLSSDAFPDHNPVPVRHTCSGPNVSPRLKWTEAPAGAGAFALIVDDPDAPGGNFVHWVLYNLDPQVKELAEGVPATDRLPGGALQGRNGFGKIGYGGPCPPPGKPHRYFFTLYALDGKLNLASGATREQLEKAMQGHILGKAQLMGTFQR
jgi:Raf kinase inhibitor-like YbhB/YbcL family protein